MKFSKLFKALGLTTVLPISASLLMISMGKAQASGQFSLTCSNIHVDSSAKLHADCRRKDQSTHNDATIDLNKYITNNDSILLWAANGNFGESCNVLGLEIDSGFNLKALCKNYFGLYLTDSDGNFIYSEIDLDKHIANINGDLTYN